MKIVTCMGVLLSLVVSNNALAEATCSYNTYQWNTKGKRAVNYQKVAHPYDQVSDEERDPITGCTACYEDQVKIGVPPIKPFYMYKAVAPKVQYIIEGL